MHRLTAGMMSVAGGGADDPDRGVSRRRDARATLEARSKREPVRVRADPGRYFESVRIEPRRASPNAQSDRRALARPHGPSRYRDTLETAPARYTAEKKAGE